MDMSVSNLTANLLISADLPVVCFYGGAGISATTTKLAITGDYPMPDQNTYFIDEDIEFRGVVTDRSVITDPLNIKIKTGVKPRVNAGIRLKFGVFILHADYTYANYSLATLGMGISFR